MSIQRKNVLVSGLGNGVLLSKLDGAVEGATEQTAPAPTVAVATVPVAQPGQPLVVSKPPVVAAPVAQPTVAPVVKGTPLPPPVPVATTAQTKGKGKGKAKPSVQELEALLAAAKEEATTAQQPSTVSNATEGTKEEAKSEPFDWSKVDLSRPYAKQKAMLALCNSLMGRKWDRQFKSTSTPEYYWTLKGEADQRHALNAIRTVAETLAALDPTLTVGPLDTTGIVGMGIEAAHNGDPTLTFAY